METDELRNPIVSCRTNISNIMKRDIAKKPVDKMDPHTQKIQITQKKARKA